MALRDNTYSQVVAWLKILLPLAALGLLSTLFLLSRTVAPTPDLPFFDDELAEKVREQQMTAPYYSGTTQNGSRLSVRASAAIPDAENNSRVSARDISATLDLVGGGVVNINSNAGVFVDSTSDLDLTGNVILRSSTGYIVLTDSLTSSLSKVAAESHAPVRGYGPVGEIDAGKMLLTSDDDTGDAHLLFTKGVRVIYKPES